MEIIEGISKLKKKYTRPVLAIGVFDGVHRGHQRVLKAVKKRAAAVRGTAMVITFFPHPVNVLHPDAYSPLIVSLPHRLQLLEDLGIDVCLLINFTARFSNIPAQKFVKNYLKRRISPVEVVVGDDFFFGKGRAYGAKEFSQLAEEHGIRLTCIGSSIRGTKVYSSTKIRNLIAQGRLARAARLLGRPVSVLGKVVHGDDRGKTLGYPTANINPENEVIPPSGVYIVQVCYRKRSYAGISSVGRRPTFKRMAEVNLEVFILDFHKNIYGQEILVNFIKKIRDEKIFLSKDHLVRQIAQDEKKVKEWFQSHSVRP